MDKDCPICGYWRIPLHKEMCSRCANDSEYDPEQDIQIKEQRMGA